MTKHFGGDRTNGLTTTFGEMGVIFIKKFSSVASNRVLTRQPLEHVARHLKITTF
jgi:hypothetical protein